MQARSQSNDDVSKVGGLLAQKKESLRVQSQQEENCLESGSNRMEHDITEGDRDIGKTLGKVQLRPQIPVAYATPLDPKTESDRCAKWFEMLEKLNNTGK